MLDLRKALNLTQSTIAKRLKKGQDMVSRIEQRDDLVRSTLEAYVESLGGKLELVCRFENGPAVRLKTVAAYKITRRSTSRAAALA